MSWGHVRRRVIGRLLAGVPPVRELFMWVVCLQRMQGAKSQISRSSLPRSARACSSWRAAGAMVRQECEVQLSACSARKEELKAMLG